jgi:hypothetical protein
MNISTFRRRLPKSALLAGFAGIGAFLAAGIARTQTAIPLAPVFATFSYADGKQVRVFATNPETIRTLTEIAAGTKGDMIPNGILADDRPGESPYDSRWSWHYQPDSLTMAEVTIEVCDATPSYVEDNMDGWFQGEPTARWCGWSAHLEKLESLIYGDVDGDRSVTVEDARDSLRIVLGLKAPNGAERIAADVYPANTVTGVPGDDVIDLRDAATLLRRAVMKD